MRRDTGLFERAADVQPVPRAARFVDFRAGIALVLAVVFAWACYAVQARDPWCCDFGSYVEIAHQYTLRGLIADTSGTRLYGYPAIVAVALWIGRLLRADLLGLLYVLQVATYLVAVTGLSHHVWRRYSHLAGRVCFFALVGNVFVYPYLTVPLADGVSVAALVFAAWAVCCIVDGVERDPHRHAKGLPAWAALGFTLGFVVMLRPANIGWIVVVLPLALLAARRAGAWLFVALLACGAGYAIAVAPQVWLNWEHFDRVGFLPSRDIGSEQLQWGLQWIKYGTRVSPLAQSIYVNPYAPDGTPGLGWYFNGFEGLRLVGLRMVAAIDVDHLFPYVTSVNAPANRVLRMLAHSVAYWGIAGLWSGHARARSGGIQQARLATWGSCIVLFLIAWAGIHATTAYENRFSMPVIAVMLPLAAWRLAALRRGARGDRVLVAAFVVYLAVWWPLATFMSSLQR